MRRTLTAVALISTVLFAVATAGSAVVLSNRVDDQSADHIKRTASFAAADQLRQSSDDLTKLARLYVVTGEERYADYFADVLAIRAGELPRPENYGGPYWDFVLADPDYKVPTADPTKLESLLEQIEQIGLAPSEVSQLRLAEDRSNELAELENEAFAAVVAGERELAIDLVFGSSYLNEKARIMEAIAAFTTFADDRTRVDTGPVDAARRMTVLLAMLTAVSALTAGGLMWVRRGE